jgi:abequosyltransferase
VTAPKLSICIATLNRGAFIGQTLESIIVQATDDVEIIVVDGASTDNTPEVVGRFRQEFPRLNYVRLAQKGGVDADYNRAVELARGEYCWLMSDDDLLKPGAISAVLTAIESSHDLIIVNSEIRNFDLSTIIEPRRLAIKSDRIYTPADYVQLFIDTAYYLSFIGGVVIKQCVWNEREKEPYIGTEFIHLGIVFQQPLQKSALVMAEPWIIIRSGNASWSSRYFSIWMFKFPQLIWSFNLFTEVAKEQVIPQAPWRRWKILIFARATSFYSLREYRQWIAPRLHSWHEYFVPLVIALGPGCLINAMTFVYFKQFRPQDRIGIMDLRTSPFFYMNCLHRLFNRLESFTNMLIH